MSRRPAEPTAEEFTRLLWTYQDDQERRQIQRYFTPNASDTFIGVRMGQVFDLAKTFIDTTPAELEKLLEVTDPRSADRCSEHHEQASRGQDDAGIPSHGALRPLPAPARPDHDLVQKPTGGMLREAGKKDPPAVRTFLDQHAAAMPRVTLRYAVERLDPAQRAQYLATRQAVRPVRPGERNPSLRRPFP